MTDNYRDEKGHFLPGNPGSPGRKPRATEQEYLSVLKDEFPPDVLAAKLKRAMELAEQQNSPRAMATVAELILSYTLGKPKQSLQVGSDDSAQLLLAILADRTPVLPPRVGIVEPPLLPGGTQDD